MQRIWLAVALSAALPACAETYRPSPNCGCSPQAAWGPASPAAARYFAAQPGAAEASATGTAAQARTVVESGLLGGAPLPGILSSGPGGSAPAAMTFRFGVGDEIATAVWKEPELTSSQKIMSDGSISPPLLKTTRVIGMTVDEVQASLTKAYSEYLKDPKVSVRVVGIQADRVFVLGEVRSPQAVILTGPTTVLQAIAMAGGFSEETAQKGGVRVLRRGCGCQPTANCMDTQSMLCGGALDEPLERGDLVYVPAKGITNWARFMGQLFSPLSTAVGTAGAAATVQQTTR